MYIQRDLVRFYEKGYLIEDNILLEALEKLRLKILHNIDALRIIGIDNGKIIKTAQNLRHNITIDCVFEDYSDIIKRISLDDLHIHYKDKTIIKTINYINETIGKKFENKLDDGVDIVLINYKNALYDILESFSKFYAFENKYKYEFDAAPTISLELSIKILADYEKDIKDILDNLIVPTILNLKDKKIKEKDIKNKLVKFIKLEL